MTLSDALKELKKNFWDFPTPNNTSTNTPQDYDKSLNLYKTQENSNKNHQKQAGPKNSPNNNPKNSFEDAWDQSFKDLEREFEKKMGGFDSFFGPRYDRGTRGRILGNEENNNQNRSGFPNSQRYFQRENQGNQGNRINQGNLKNQNEFQTEKPSIVELKRELERINPQIYLEFENSVESKKSALSKKDPKDLNIYKTMEQTKEIKEKNDKIEYDRLRNTLENAKLDLKNSQQIEQKNEITDENEIQKYFNELKNRNSKMGFYGDQSKSYENSNQNSNLDIFREFFREMPNSESAKYQISPNSNTKTWSNFSSTSKRIETLKNGKIKETIQISDKNGSRTEVNIIDPATGQKEQISNSSSRSSPSSRGRGSDV